jgi:tetratricopeptide (TPR) repeat protein
LRTAGGELLWSESFDEPIDSATSGRFARAPFVARTIEALVRSAHLADRLRTRSEPARRHFFLGLREVDAYGYGVGDSVVAASHFERALAHDPEMRHALEQLAYAYALRLDEAIRADEALARAHVVLPRLLQVDPNATLSLSFVNQNLDLDYTSALANIDHARRHGFGDVATVEFYKGLVRLKQGHFEEAVERLQAAVGAGLGSREAHAHYFLVDAHWALGRFEAALASVDRALRTASPDWFRGRMIRIRIAQFMGKTDEAQSDLGALWSDFGETHRASFPSVFAPLGQPELAREILRENDAAWRDGRLHLCSYSFGAHCFLGEFDQAFVWLDRAIENREWWMLPFLRSEIFYGNVRSDSRFHRAMARLAEIEATPSPTKSVATGAARP